MTQTTWFDLSNQDRQRGKVERYRERYGTVEQTRDQGIELVHRNADTAWKRAARERLQEVIRTHETFTADDILINLEERGIVTGDTRAIAAILIAARKAGQIEATDNFTPTKRPASHKRPIRVWRVIK